MFAKYFLLYDPGSIQQKVKSAEPLGDSLDDFGLVVDGIDKLNGEDVSQLFIFEDLPTDDSELPWEGQGLEVSGGENKFYCEISSSDFSAYAFDESVTNEDEWTIIRRGQSTSVPIGSILTKSTTLTISKVFAETGEMYDGVSWKKKR